MEIQVEKYEHLRETVAHGNAMLPFMVHSLTNEEMTEERIYVHWHEEMEFLLITEGKATVSVGEQSYEVGEGDFVLIWPDRLHGMTAEPGVRVSFLAIDFAIEFLYSFDNDSLQQKYLEPIRENDIIFIEYYQKDGGWKTQIFNLLTELGEFFSVQKTGYELLIKARLYEILALLYIHAEILTENRQKDRRSEQIRQVMTYLQEHYTSAVTMDELSREFHMSTGHLCRMFKSITGHSITEYLNDYRIRMSTCLLREGELDIGEIAMRVGFNNISYYNKRFRQYMHQTPSQYRKGLCIS